MSFNESIYINTVRNRYCRADVGQEKSQSIDNELACYFICRELLNKVQTYYEHELSKSVEVPPPFRLVAEYRRR